MSSPQPSSDVSNCGNSSSGSSSSSNGAIPQRIFVQRNVPAFLNKLYSMVNDPTTDNLIHWSKDGNSFIVEGHEQFAKSVLPRFYKHNTFASFVRQLNMYDFHKVPHLQQGVLISDAKHERWEFSNPNFQRSRPEMLVLVTRKRNRERGDEEDVSLATLVKDITAIRKHQTSISSELHTMQRDNAVLWEESLTAREKHQRHQDVIAKILQFLTAVFSNDRALGMSKHSILSSSSSSESVLMEHSGTSTDSSLLQGDNNNNNDDHSSKGIFLCTTPIMLVNLGYVRFSPFSSSLAFEKKRKRERTVTSYYIIIETDHYCCAFEKLSLHMHIICFFFFQVVANVPPN
ncbi:hypothetical protein BDB00DRAFT_775412 [Zychaea mexicana]|uniref:uncharacterized protein n=1 Tax=Zychaea mexicana TaxID=64656 RepID=UPI0022FE6DD1|nr:uncharacterized protein BDB00DRAFT_775412 [Zychaea mexicana]KAI9482524.1 hypothetical protein BDB00DRAFT_775412 [Zychaea mexicana]